MKTTCNREKLLHAFQTVAPVAPARSPKPILQNVKFEVTKDAAILMATDLENLQTRRSEIYAELGEALAGKVPSRATETTIFKSLGMAVEDIAAALLVYRSSKAGS